MAVIVTIDPYLVWLQAAIGNVVEQLLLRFVGLFLNITISFLADTIRLISS